MAAKRRWATLLARAPASTAAIRGIEAAGMNLIWVASRLRATRREFSALGFGEARLPDGVADVPDDRLGDRAKRQPAIRARTLRSTSSQKET